jgi:hypothetical protein
MAKKPLVPPEPFDDDTYLTSVVARSIEIAQAFALDRQVEPARPRLVLPEGAIDVTREMMGKVISVVGVPVPKPAEDEG